MVPYMYGIENYLDFTQRCYMPITEEMLVDFIIEHGVECAEDLDDLSYLIHLIRAEANTPCGAMWTEEVTVH